MGFRDRNWLWPPALLMGTLVTVPQRVPTLPERPGSGLFQLACRRSPARALPEAPGTVPGSGLVSRGLPGERSVKSAHGSPKKPRRHVKARGQRSRQGVEAGSRHAASRTAVGRIGASAEAREEAVASPPLVLIEWLDSCGCSARWQDLDADTPRAVHCRSVGWLLHDNPDCKVIVPHLTAPHPYVARQGCGDMTIPASAILSVVSLRRAGRHGVC